MANQAQPALSLAIKVLMYRDLINLPKYLQKVGNWLDEATKTRNTNNWHNRVWVDAILYAHFVDRGGDIPSSLTEQDLSEYVRKAHGNDYSAYAPRLKGNDLTYELMTAYHRISSDMAKGAFSKSRISTYFEWDDEELAIIDASQDLI